MENAEISINANAIGGFDGMDAHKKGLLVDQSDVDSGFVSNWSISHSNATASTSGLSSSAKFSSLSFKRSLDLETISENNELKDLQETPTTRNARHLNAFHINTPQNTRNELETTPKKANYFSNLHDSGIRGSSKKNRSQNNIRWSFERSSPKLRSSVQRMKSFAGRSSLFESIDESFENGENVHNQSIGVSPIKPHNTSNLMVQPPEQLHNLQRHPSGIESSTPKTNFKRTRTQSIVKPKASLADELARDRLLRKTQSFSPAKRLALRETNFQHSIEPVDAYNEADEPQPYNPARKVLAFTAQKFDQLVQKNPSSVIQTSTKSHIVNDFGTIYEGKPGVASPKSKQLQLKRLDSHKSQSQLAKEFLRKKSMRPMVPLTPNKVSMSLNESDILASLATEHETDLYKATVQCGTDDNLMDISSDSAVPIIQTPSTNKQLQTILSDTPIRDDGVKKNIREEANRTPTKRFEKSTSYNFLSVKSCSEKEKFDIVYEHLPCTPPKNHQRRPLKRPAARIDSPQPTEPSAKRKLYQNKLCERTMFYNGIETLDILTQLVQQFKMINIVGQILSYLPSSSLQAASSVCKSWKVIVDENPKFRSKRRKFVKQMQMVKENVNHYEIKPNVNNNINNNNTKPLHIHNKNYQVDVKPTPVSPSTQRFNEHQQIVRNLKSEQRVLQCPRCNGPSIVHPATGNETKAQRRSPRRQPHQMFILQDRSLRSSVNNATKNKRIIGMAKVVVSEYAACSKKACGYEFCTNCICNRHVNAKCTKRPLGSSPKSDDDSPYKPEHRSTKRDLRRLRRLVF